jgi:hypothetical protein
MGALPMMRAGQGFFILKNEEIVYIIAIAMDK